MKKMKKNSIIATTTLIVILLAGFSIYQFTKKDADTIGDSNSSDNSNSRSEMKMDTGMSMNDESMMGGMMINMSELVKDDQSFIENMIPHHEEAVTSSKEVLASTTDPELKNFVQNVIAAQTEEINAMKIWYKDWFGKEYTPNNNYQAMMGSMNGKTGTELDKEYTKSMIMHHQGAIQMAEKIKTITKRPELLQLANDIITTQTTERSTLMNWVMTKYGDHSMMGM